VVYTDFGGTSEVSYALVGRSDGSLISAGRGGSHPNMAFAVSENQRNGSLDRSFDGDGKVLLSFAADDDTAYDVAVQPDGKIVVSGHSVNPANTTQSRRAIGRLLPNGSPDPAFGSFGKVITDVGAGQGEADAVVVQSTGRVVAAGPIGTSGEMAGYLGDVGPSCTRIGTAGRDRVTGTKMSDVLCGFKGNDTLTGLGADDLYFGGPGSDTASFARSKAAVTVDLGGGTASGEGSDTLASIERAVGSSKGDMLTGSPGPNVLSGGGGADKLFGLLGNDRLLGGSGNDTLNGGPGIDTCVQGPGSGPKTSCEH
jgi:uncharacterized delta-60 repeat protein